MPTCVPRSARCARITVMLLAAPASRVAAQAPAFLVKDVRPGARAVSSAPAGYATGGATTLFRAWAQTTGLPVFSW